MGIFVFVSVLSQSSSDDCDPHEGIHQGKESKYRLQVTQFVQRLEYWHKELTNTLVTSITVVPVHGRAVAYLGTADGRHIQVKRPRCPLLSFYNTHLLKNDKNLICVENTSRYKE